jgi:U5 snRNP protein, DIM1 family
MDEMLLDICDDIENVACVFIVDIEKVPDFNTLYELYDPVSVMFFYRNKHIMIDLGTGDNNKINWALTDRQELLDIIEVVYKGARQGKGLVTAPKAYYTKHKY